MKTKDFVLDGPAKLRSQKKDPGKEQPTYTIRKECNIRKGSGPGIEQRVIRRLRHCIC